MSKKILFVSTVFPYPVDTGKKVVLSGFFKYLSQKYSGHLQYVCIGDSQNNDSTDVNGTASFHFYDKPPLRTQLWNLLYYVLIRRSKSLQEAFLFSKDLQEQLTLYVKQHKPDIIICDTIRIGQFFENPSRYPAYYILYLEDLFSIRYHKMIDTLRQISDIKLNALGNFGKFIPSFLRIVVNHTCVQKALLHFEKYLITKREDTIVHKFPKSLLINNDEVNILINRSNVSSIFNVRPFLSQVPETQRRVMPDPVFIFLGVLNVPHNEVSIKHFITTQMERLIAKIPNVKLRIIGKYASDDLKNLASRYEDNISIEGYVESLENVFSESTGMIIPLLFGSGVKLKTLEAMARGLPIISTDYGIEGIALERSMDCIVENDISSFPQHMLRLMNEATNRFFSDNSANFFLKYYAKENIYRHYDTIFCED